MVQTIKFNGLCVLWNQLRNKKLTGDVNHVGIKMNKLKTNFNKQLSNTMKRI